MSDILKVKVNNEWQSIPAIKGDNGEGVPEGGTTGQVLKKKTNTDYDTEWGTVDALPSQSGQSGKYLTTNGTQASWGTIDLSSKQDTLVSGTNIKTINSNSILGSGNLDIDGLPSQTGQSGKYLTTNGTNASWGSVSSYHPDIFSHQWCDHLLNNISWLRADTFSWQSGSVYVTAYNELVSEYNNASSTTETEGEVAWTQPILTSNTTSTALGNIVVTTGSEASGYDAYKALDGVKSGTDVNTGWGTDNVSSSWWQIKFPYKLRITGLKGYSRYDGTQVHANTVGRFYTSSNMTTPIGDEYTNSTGTAWNEVSVTGIPASGIITDTIYFNKTGGGNWGGLGELEITATRLTLDSPITFRRTPKGYKIADSTQETAILNKYNTDGIAWYYILDTANTRFKLPRTKFGFEGLRDTVGNDVGESLPNIKGEFYSGDTDGFFVNSTDSSPFYSGSSVPKYLTATSGGSPTKLGFDASRSSSTYQDNAPVQERATQMYLYFYVGEYAQTAIEQTAGITSEQLNAKVDVASLSTINPMITSYVNGTSGYNIWANGYCEQWGIVSSSTVSFLKIFRDTNYNISFGYREGTDGCWFAQNKTVNSFQQYVKYYGIERILSSSANHWKACGYLAEGQY